MTKHPGPFRIAIREEEGWVNGYCCQHKPKPEDVPILLFKVRRTAMEMGGEAAFDSLMLFAKVLSEGMLQHAIPELKHEDISVHYVAPGKDPENLN